MNLRCLLIIKKTAYNKSHGTVFLQLIFMLITLVTISPVDCGVVIHPAELVGDVRLIMSDKDLPHVDHNGDLSPDLDEHVDHVQGDVVPGV
jgi:hypothetical protein